MNALTPIVTDTSELVATIERARYALDAGDVKTAYLLSSGTYDQAKAAANYAGKVKASQELIDKARRMQADALKIETLCTIAMADAVDEAQAQGKVSRGGRPETVQSADRFSLEEVGISKQRLHDARHLRNAERANPGFIERVVEARVSEGIEPSRAALKNAAGHAIGTKSASKEERGDDLYETPIEATRMLLALESFSSVVKEPAVGRGAILRPLEASGYEVIIADLVDRGVSTRHGELAAIGDFLQSVAGDTAGVDIVTNPPYGIANAFLAHALREHKPRKMAALLNANFMFGFEDYDRNFVMSINPPTRVYLNIHRLPTMHRDGWEGNKASSQMNTAWFVWERNDDGSYGIGENRFESIRVNYSDYETAAPLPPGAGGNVGPMVFGKSREEPKRTTPLKTIDQRVEEEFERAMLWIKHLEPFDLRRFRNNVAVRDDVAKALLDAMQANGLIDDAGDGKWIISSKGISTAINVAAFVAVRDLKAGKSKCAQNFEQMAERSEIDPLYQSALDLVRRTGRASTTLFKKELGLGFNKASGLIERMQADGFVSPFDAAGQRIVFMDKLEGAA
jgi:hypothetical protein